MKMSARAVIINGVEHSLISFDKPIYYLDSSNYDLDVAEIQDGICELMVRNAQLQPTSAIIPSSIETSTGETVAVHYTPATAITYAICFARN
jgi:hypothetical protein